MCILTMLAQPKGPGGLGPRLLGEYRRHLRKCPNLHSTTTATPLQARWLQAAQSARTARNATQRASECALAQDTSTRPGGAGAEVRPAGHPCNAAFQPALPSFTPLLRRCTQCVPGYGRTPKGKCIACKVPGPLGELGTVACACWRVVSTGCAPLPCGSIGRIPKRL